MSDLMLRELEAFMLKYKITFLRSASSSHELVLSQKIGDKFIDYIFDEGCDYTDLRYKRYATNEDAL